MFSSSTSESQKAAPQRKQARRSGLWYLANRNINVVHISINSRAGGNLDFLDADRGGSCSHRNYPSLRISTPIARDWGADSKTGIVPVGARSAAVSIQEIKVASGTAIDGYVDNVNISIGQVPEPGAAGLFALGGGLLALARRARKHPR